MLFIAFMLNILKIRFDFLCSDTVLLGKWKVKTQHEVTISFCHYTNGKKRNAFQRKEKKKTTSHGEMDAGVWKLGCVCMHASKCHKACLGRESS